MTTIWTCYVWRSAAYGEPHSNASLAVPFHLAEAAAYGGDSDSLSLRHT